MISNNVSWKSIGWFALVLTVILSYCALVIPVRPLALAQTFNKQYMLEKDLSAIEIGLTNPKIPSEVKYALFKQAEDIKKELMQYKPSLTGDHYYQGFVVLISLPFFLLLLAVMNYFSLPLRLGFFCSGMILAIISFLQWLNALISGPTFFHVKMVNFIMVLSIGFASLGFCILFMRKLYHSKN